MMNRFFLIFNAYRFALKSSIKHWIVSICLIFSLAFASTLPYIFSGIEALLAYVTGPETATLFLIITTIIAILTTAIVSAIIIINVIKIGSKIYNNQTVSLKDILIVPTCAEIVQVALIAVATNVIFSPSILNVFTNMQWIVWTVYIIALLVVSRFILTPFILLDQKINILTSLKRSWQETRYHFIESIVMVFSWLLLAKISTSIMVPISVLLVPFYAKFDILNQFHWWLITVSLASVTHIIFAPFFLVSMWAGVAFYKQVKQLNVTNR